MALIFCGLGYLVYKRTPHLQEKIGSQLVKILSSNNLEPAYAKFLASCESAAKESLKSRLSPALETKIHAYCLCAQGEFKKQFSPQELLSIGLNQLSSKPFSADQEKKVEDITQKCKSNLQETRR